MLHSLSNFSEAINIITSLSLELISFLSMLVVLMILIISSWIFNPACSSKSCSDNNFLNDDLKVVFPVIS